MSEDGEFTPDGEFVERKSSKQMSLAWLLDFANQDAIEQQYKRILQEAEQAHLEIDDNTKEILKEETTVAVAETNRLLHWNHAEVITPTECNISSDGGYGVICTTVTRNPPGDYNQPRGHGILVWKNNVYYVGHGELVDTNNNTRTFLVAVYRIEDQNQEHDEGEFLNY